MASRFARATARANRVFMDRLSDGNATYTPTSGPALLAVPYQLDLSFEMYDPEGMARRVTTILLPVALVPHSALGDQVVTPARTYHVEQVIEDDGDWRRVWVT